MKIENLRNREILVMNFFAKKTNALRWFFLIITVLFAGVTTYLFMFENEFKKYLPLAIAMTVFSLFIFILLIFRISGKFLKNKEYRKIVKDDYKNAFEACLKTFGLNSDDLCYNEPFVFFNPSAFPHSNKYVSKYDKKSNSIFYSHSEISSVLFGKEELYIYSSHIDHVTGINSFEKAKECRYEDIISVNTKTDISKRGKFFNDILTVSFTFNDGTSSELLVRNTLSQSSSFKAPLLKSIKSKIVYAALVLLQVVFSAAAFALPYYFIDVSSFISLPFAAETVKIASAAIAMVISLVPALVLGIFKVTYKLTPYATKLSEDELKIVTSIRKVIRENKSVNNFALDIIEEEI